MKLMIFHLTANVNMSAAAVMAPVWDWFYVCRIGKITTFFHISNNQYFQYCHVINSNWTTVVQWTQTDLIKTLWG